MVQQTNHIRFQERRPYVKDVSVKSSYASAVKSPNDVVDIEILHDETKENRLKSKENTVLIDSKMKSQKTDLTNIDVNIDIIATKTYVEEVLKSLAEEITQEVYVLNKIMFNPKGVDITRDRAIQAYLVTNNHTATPLLDLADPNSTTDSMTAPYFRLSLKQDDFIVT